MVDEVARDRGAKTGRTRKEQYHKTPPIYNQCPSLAISISTTFLVSIPSNLSPAQLKFSSPLDFIND